MNLYTSDLHLCHANIIKYEDRPFSDIYEMNAALIANWNRKVKRGDCVYILGDFAFADGITTNKLLDQLNGQKYLIKGNHDSFLKDNDFDKTKFVWIRDYQKIKDEGKDIILFHYPIAVWDKQHHGSIHLYGHVHSAPHNAHEEAVNVKSFPNAFNVGVDVNDFEPKTLNELLSKIR